ncbi:unnamed protein product [Rotaria sp. Silwood1]|nr:unnamed protein product [Rotaria sp. Silwood1]CAF3470390.1 unnamed protein product [Rotaria sp. Silwood1]CAF3539549.1 unnamed protein product [Rotaria sp. Silwood1]CAF4659544.1 unnamed protein product [Rotaria sp. Silwood1]
MADVEKQNDDPLEEQKEDEDEDESEEEDEDEREEEDEDESEEEDEKENETNDDNISSLFEQICEELISMRQDDLELAEQLTSLYDDLCRLRQILTNSQLNYNRDIIDLPIHIDSSTSSYFHPKQRSDSEPNILSDRLRLITILDDLQ